MRHSVPRGADPSTVRTARGAMFMISGSDSLHWQSEQHRSKHPVAQGVTHYELLMFGRI